MSNNIEIAKLRRDGGTQPRAVLDEATIAEYAEAVANGAEFPPVVVFHDGEALWLADGFHRVAAHERAGKHVILATVRQGDRRAAVLYSTGVNAEHGLRRTNADKRRAVDVLLRDAEWGKWSDREIARQCKVSNNFVSELRRLICHPMTDELSCTNVQDSSGATERHVTRAGVTYTMNTANVGSNPPAYLTGDEVAAAVRAALPELAGGAEHLRAVLTQINIYSPVGQNYLTKLTEQLPGKARLADVQTACRAWLAELTAADRPAAKAVAFAPGEQQMQIWELERAVRNYLAGFPASTAASQLSMVRSMIRRDDPGGLHYYSELKGKMVLPYREGDLRQALNNVRDQLEQAAAPVINVTPAALGLRSEAAVNEAARHFEPLVWRFLGVPPTGGTFTQLDHARRLTGSLLDVEGFHAPRGRNFDWEALVGSVGPAGQNDQEALRVAVQQVRATVLAQFAAVAVLPEEIEPEPAAEPDVISQWLAVLAEENEIPTGRDGAPERDAVRTILRSIINDRTNGGARYYRSLLKHPAWPAGTDERAKLAAVRQALADLGGTVVEPERRPPSWAGVRPATSGGPALAAPRTAKDDATTALIARKDQHIRHLVTAVDKALGYLGSLAEQRNGDQDEDLLECISALRLARAEALNED